jgi:hypothetical protein
VGPPHAVPAIRSRIDYRTDFADSAWTGFSVLIEQGGVNQLGRVGVAVSAGFLVKGNPQLQHCPEGTE